MINSKEEQFKAIQLRDEVTIYRSNSKKELPNAFTLIEIPAGINTPLIAKRVPYSKMTRKHGREGEIISELATRNIT